MLGRVEEDAGAGGGGPEGGHVGRSRQRPGFPGQETFVWVTSATGSLLLAVIDHLLVSLDAFRQVGAAGGGAEDPVFAKAVDQRINQLARGLREALFGACTPG